MSVQVSNFSDTPRDRLAIDFQINDQTVEKREVSLNARETKVVEFTGFNLTEGANRCVVEVGSGDFAADNKFYFTIRREAPAKALDCRERCAWPERQLLPSERAELE